MGFFDKKPPGGGVNAYGKPKLPVGQTATEKFPVLTYGETPRIDLASWRFRVFGLVDEREWTWNEFLQLPQTSLRADFHCVTHWSRFDDLWEGVLVRDLVSRVTLKPGAKHVLQHAYGGYTTNLPLQWMMEEDVLLAHRFNGEALPMEHGGPVRVFTPKRYAWKGAKWIHAFEFLAHDKPGFWEQNGYSNTADPWKEERFW
jgi:DMSO/TMAO reductase YedYZ molybdopterin-dependent catalytic subunit